MAVMSAARYSSEHLDWNAQGAGRWNGRAKRRRLEGEEEEEEEEEEGEEGSGEGDGEDGEDGQDGEDDGGDEEGDEDASDDVSVAETEVAEQPTISDDDSEGSFDGDRTHASPSAAPHGGGSAKRQYVSMDVSPALAAELDAFDAHRAAPLNHSRTVVLPTVESRPYLP